jgi:hypothetical protein
MIWLRKLQVSSTNDRASVVVPSKPDFYAYNQMNTVKSFNLLSFSTGTFLRILSLMTLMTATQVSLAFGASAHLNSSESINLNVVSADQVNQAVPTILSDYNPPPSGGPGQSGGSGTR